MVSGFTDNKAVKETPTRSTRSHQILSPKGSRRVLDNAVSICLDNWLPINKILYESLQEKVVHGTFHDDKESFFETLKKDVFLYSYFLKRCYELGAIDTQNMQDPFLQNIDNRYIHLIFSLPYTSLSKHSTSEISKVQALRVKFSVISSTTSELLANSDDSLVSSEVSFNAALLRQLPMNLIAWNYPFIYSRALMKGVEELKSIDNYIYNLLGFMPEELGIKLAEKIGFGSNFTKLFDISREKLLKHDLESPLLKVVRYSQIGETLARISDPEHYPDSIKEVELFKRDIEEILGEEGLQQVSEKIKERTGEYTGKTFKNISFEISLEKSLKTVNKNFSKELFIKNSYLQKCSDEVKIILWKVYDLIKPYEFPTEAINELVTTTIQMLGFKKGCLYILQTNSMVLLPKLRLGDTELSRYQPLSLKNAQHLKEKRNGLVPLVDALYSSAPIKQRNVFMYNEEISHITWALESRKIAGILHLEYQQENEYIHKTDLVLIFKAIQRCLVDCLEYKV
jgi:hypothetical protein